MIDAILSSIIQSVYFSNINSDELAISSMIEAAVWMEQDRPARELLDPFFVEKLCVSNTLLRAFDEYVLATQCIRFLLVPIVHKDWSRVFPHFLKLGQDLKTLCPEHVSPDAMRSIEDDGMDWWGFCKLVASDHSDRCISACSSRSYASLLYVWLALRKAEIVPKLSFHNLKNNSFDHTI